MPHVPCDVPTSGPPQPIRLPGDQVLSSWQQLYKECLAGQHGPLREETAALLDDGTMRHGDSVHQTALCRALRSGKWLPSLATSRSTQAVATRQTRPKAPQKELGSTATTWLWATWPAHASRPEPRGNCQQEPHQCRHDTIGLVRADTARIVDICISLHITCDTIGSVFVFRFALCSSIQACS